MATRYVGINRGQQHQDVVDGLSTNSTDLELTFDPAKYTTFKELYDHVQKLLSHQKRQKWSRPAA